MPQTWCMPSSCRQHDGLWRRCCRRIARTSGSETTGSRELVYLVNLRYIRRTWEVRRSDGAFFSYYVYLSSAVFPRPGYRGSYLIFYPLAQRLELNQPRLEPRPPWASLGARDFSRELDSIISRFSRLSNGIASSGGQRHRDVCRLGKICRHGSGPEIRARLRCYPA